MERVSIQVGGRLANQMFEYATARALATRLGAELIIEGYAPESGDKSKTQIFDSFNIRATFHPIKKSRVRKWKLKLARRGWPLRIQGLPIYMEPHFHYDDGFEAIDSGRYLVGGWISYRYFTSIREDLLCDFALKKPLSDNAAKTLEAIRRDQCPVAIHVRRGDYIDNPRILQKMGICEIDYYKAAIQVIEQFHPNASYYLFSDDIELASKELQGVERLNVVSGNSQEDDLFLMSSCHHNIIANSTFSWWAAWLNTHADKLVIAPKKWFGPRLADQLETKDMFPDDWMLV